MKNKTKWVVGVIVAVLLIGGGVVLANPELYQGRLEIRRAQLPPTFEVREPDISIPPTAEIREMCRYANSLRPLTVELRRTSNALGELLHPTTGEVGSRIWGVDAVVFEDGAGKQRSINSEALRTSSRAALSGVDVHLGELGRLLGMCHHYGYIRY